MFGVEFWGGVAAGFALAIVVGWVVAARGSANDQAEAEGRPGWTFSEYAECARRTAIYEGGRLPELVYVTLGLVGESGEVADEVKKAYRDSGGFVDGERHERLVAECGDVLWYLAMVCFELGVSFEYVAATNLAKLEARYG